MAVSILTFKENVFSFIKESHLDDPIYRLRQMALQNIFFVAIKKFMPDEDEFLSSKDKARFDEHYRNIDYSLFQYEEKINMSLSDSRIPELEWTLQRFIDQFETFLWIERRTTEDLIQQNLYRQEDRKSFLLFLKNDLLSIRQKASFLPVAFLKIIDEEISFLGKVIFEREKLLDFNSSKEEIPSNKPKSLTDGMLSDLYDRLESAVLKFKVEEVPEGSSEKEIFIEAIRSIIENSSPTTEFFLKFRNVKIAYYFLHTLNRFTVDNGLHGIDFEALERSGKVTIVGGRTLGSPFCAGQMKDYPYQVHEDTRKVIDFCMKEFLE